MVTYPNLLAILSTAAQVRSLLCSPPAPAAEVGRDGRGGKPRRVAAEGQPQLVCAGRAGPRSALWFASSVISLAKWESVIFSFMDGITLK